MGGAVTIDPAPTGSSAQQNLSASLVSETIASSELDSLANATETSALSYSNPFSKTYATVTIFLNPITPSSGGTVQIISGSTGYEISVNTTNTARRLEFVDIATSFLSSFTVKNNTGVALNSTGNFVYITPKY